MGERVKQIFARVKEFFSNMNKRLRTILILALVLALAVIVGLAVYRSTRPYTVLFTGLSSDDMSAVLTYLSDNNVNDYRIQNNDTILVRASQEAELKAGIIQQGYPTSGYAYETYLNNVGMLSSESDRQQLTRYDLQDQLSAVIRRFDGVRDATVTIAMATENRYILSDTVVDATAAVFVEMQPGRTLSDRQVTGIRNYVTHSVQGLDFSSVTIEDGAGNQYGGGGSTSVSDIANLKLSLEEQVDSNIRSKILAELVPLFGLSNLSVSVNSTVDVNHTYSESTMYHEPAWAEDGSSGGKGIIGTWVWDSGLVRGEDAAAGGVVGTSTNADLNEYVINQGDITGNEQEIGTSGEIDYNVSQTVTQTENQGGMITDLMVSIAINSRIVDNPTEINTTALYPLVGRAAGISSEYETEKIAIVVYPFFVETQDEAPAETTPGGILDMLPSWALYALIAGGALFLLLLVLFLVLRRKAKKKKKDKERLAQLQREQQLSQFTPNVVSTPVASEQGADIMDLNTERSMELRKDVRQFAEDNPAIAAQMVKNWLRGSEDHG